MAKPRPKKKEQLPVVQDQDPNEVAKLFADEIADLEQKYNALRAEEPGPMKARMALEFSHDAKRFIDQVNHHELLGVQRDRLFQAHRTWNKLVKRALMPGELLLKLCLDVRSDWEIRRRKLVDDERQKREQQANLFATQQKEAEVQHLREIGKQEEADTIAAAPIVPITVNVDPDLGKPAGEIMVEVWQPKRDDDGNIVFTDLVSYLAWIAGNPALYHLVSHEYGKLKKLLTDNHGTLKPPGLEIEHKFEPRTRREAESNG